MAKINIFWDPMGLELDSLGKKKYVSATDGDTPYVSISIRMLSIDAPEVHYPGTTKPSKYDDKLKELADLIDAGKAPIEHDLANFLKEKLKTGKAGTLQETQGLQATEEFHKIVSASLTKPNGKKRNVFLLAADEHFDQYGRLLAYMSPYYEQAELATLSLRQRATFNLMMIEAGWAASFPIYPSLPKNVDLILMHDVAKEAYDNKKGIWADPYTLLGYEYRMCVRLYEITKKLISGKKVSSQERKSWIERFCVDMTSREIFYPQEYFKVKPYNRIFIWPVDVTEAVARMNLVPAP